MNSSPPSPGSAWFPSFARFFRCVLGSLQWFVGLRKVWRVVGRVCVGLAVLATLIALVLAEEDVRGKWAWSRYRHKLEAQGEKLDFRNYIPPPVPDDQNFAMTPLLAPLFDYAGSLDQGAKWRDTNGLALIFSLGQGRLNVEPDTTERGLQKTLQRMTDLQAWAASLAAKTNPAGNITAEAAEVFRRRYGVDPPPELQPPPPLGPVAEAAVEAFRRRYGLAMTAEQEEAFRRRYGLEPSIKVAPPVKLESKAAEAAMTRPKAAAEVLRLLEPYDPVLEELRSASRRPHARFNIHYEDEFAPAILLPHLAVLRRLSRLFELRASAELVLGRTDQAWADTKMALYLADTLKNEPFLISKMVQVAMVELGLHPIWEGLADHKWSDAHLAEIEQRLSQINLLADAALRGEWAFNILAFDQMRHLGMLDPDNYSGRLTGPTDFLLGGFYYQNQLFLAGIYQQHLVTVVDAANQRLYPSRGFANDAALTNAVAGGFRPYRVGGQLLLRGLVSAQARFGFGQTRVNEAIVACALERYRLAQGQYPESLEALSPRFVQKVPHDLITGGPLKYHRTADGRFVLYCVGWNEKDDGGQVAQPKAEETGSDVTEGDWVWRYPATAPKAASQQPQT